MKLADPVGNNELRNPRRPNDPGLQQPNNFAWETLAEPDISDGWLAP